MPRSIMGRPKGVILNNTVDCWDHSTTVGTKDAFFLLHETWIDRLN